jgi:uridine phosphorylase
MEFSPSDLILNADGSVYHLGLRPENLSHKIITVGDPDRVPKVSQYFDSIEFEKKRREFVTHTGMYKGKRLSVISTGMGTDNIEILMHELDMLVNIDLTTRTRKAEQKALTIVRVGTSGSLQADIPMGSHLVSVAAIGLDTLMMFYNLKQNESEYYVSKRLQDVIGLPFQPYCVRGSVELAENIGLDMIKGNTLTCPGFYAPQGRKIRIPLRFPDLVEKLNTFNPFGFKLTNFEMETAGYYSLGRLLGHEVLSVNAIVANRITQEFDTKADETVENLILKVLDRI